MDYYIYQKCKNCLQCLTAAGGEAPIKKKNQAGTATT